MLLDIASWLAFVGACMDWVSGSGFLRFGVGLAFRVQGVLVLELLDTQRLAFTHQAVQSPEPNDLELNKLYVNPKPRKRSQDTGRRPPCGARRPGRLMLGLYK